MKSRLFLFCSVLLWACCLPAQNLSTGIDNAGNSLAIGDLDPNWHTVNSPNLPATEARACGFYPGYWEPAPIAGTNAMWINFSGDYMNNIPGTYTFEREFTVLPGTTSFVTNFRAAFDDIPLAFNLVSPTGLVIPLPYTMTNWYHLTQIIPREVTNPTPGTWRIRAQINFFDSAAAFLLSGDIRHCGTLLPQNLQTDLIAYYPFNGGSLLDYSPNHLDLSNSSGIPHVAGDRNGKADCAYEFPGGPNDFLSAAMPTGLIPDANTPFSISLWYKPMSSNVSGFELLLGRGTGSTCPDGMGEIALGLSDCRVPMMRFNQNSCADVTQGGTWCGDQVQQYLLQGWQHLAVVYDPLQPVGSQISMYRNGQLSVNFAGPCGNPYADAGDLMIGLGYLGLVDDIFFYKRALATAEVHELMAMGSSCCQFLITSTDEAQPSHSVALSPNPNNGQFKVTLAPEIASEGCHITVCDALGRTVWSRALPSGSQQIQLDIDCEGRPAGIYFLRVQTADQSTVHRVVLE